MNVQVIIDRLRLELPPVFTRKIVAKLIGGYLTVGSLANLDSLGEGPGGIRAGKSILYERETFLEWLAKRMTVEASHE